MANYVTLLARTAITLKVSKHNIKGIDGNVKVADFRAKAAAELNLTVNEFELIYCGQRLKDDKALSWYDVKPGVTIHVIKKACQENTNTEPLGHEAIRNLTSAITPILKNRTRRRVLEEMLRKAETHSNLLALVPGLGADPIAIAVLHDMEMFTFAMLEEPSVVQKVLERHPALGRAAIKLVADYKVLHNDTAAGPSHVNRADLFGFGAMEDDDSDDEDDYDVDPSASNFNINQPPAGPSGRHFAPYGSTAPAAATGGGGGGVITTDFFRQAMLEATGASIPLAPTGEIQLQSQLQQLHEMGITDEARARRALEATGGDINAAVEMLFNEDSF